MATMVLAFAAPALGVGPAFGAAGMAGGVVLGLFAAVVDSRVIMPKLFPADDPEGPKIDGQQLSPATEGAPANLVFGTGMRIGGTVVWLSNLIEISSTSGGKGGGYKVEQTEYKIDAAVAICANEIDTVDRVWADGKIIYSSVASVLFTATDISSAYKVSYTTLIQPLTGFEDPSLAWLQAGFDVEITGFARKGDFNNYLTPPNNNSLWFVGTHTKATNPLMGSPFTMDTNGGSLSGYVELNDGFYIDHTGGAGRRYYKFGGRYTASGGQITGTLYPGLAEGVANDTKIDVVSGSCGIYEVLSVTPKLNGTVEARVANTRGQNKTAGDSVTIDQDGVGYPASRLASLTAYSGTDYQDPDPLLESYLGAGNVPAARGVAYVVLEGLVLTDFGNRMPNLTFRVRAKSSESFSTVASSLIGRSRMPALYYDLSNVANPAAHAIPGFSVQGTQSTSEALTPMMLQGNYLAREEGGKLVFYERDSVPNRTVDASDLGAGERDQRADYPLSVQDMDDFDLPAEMRVQFLDPALDYQTGTVTERATYAQGDSSATVSLNMTLTADAARELAKRLLWTPRATRQRVSLSLPPSYLGIAENELLTITALDHTWTLLTQRVDRGANGLIEVECIVEDSTAFDFDYVPDSAPEGLHGSSMALPAPALGYVLDLPPLSDAHATQPGFYYALGSWDPMRWTGASVYISNDGGTNFDRVVTSLTRATLGFAADVLPSASTHYWDRASTVTVEITSGELSSATPLAVLNGANRALLGDEIIGYQTATLIEEGTYALSGLLRGLRDTGAATSTHAVGERFVLLDSAVGFHPMNFGDAGRTRPHKIVAGGQFPSAITASDLTTDAVTLRAFSPAHVKKVVQTNGDITITWRERTRRIVRLLSPDGAPPIDAVTYEVDIMNGSAVLRTYAASSESTTYTYAHQTADGTFTDARVYQISPTTGRGLYTAVDLT